MIIKCKEDLLLTHVDKSDDESIIERYLNLCSKYGVHDSNSMKVFTHIVHHYKYDLQVGSDGVLYCPPRIDMKSRKLKLSDLIDLRYSYIVTHKQSIIDKYKSLCNKALHAWVVIEDKSLYCIINDPYEDNLSVRDCSYGHSYYELKSLLKSVSGCSEITEQEIEILYKEYNEN